MCANCSLCADFPETNMVPPKCLVLSDQQSKSPEIFSSLSQKTEPQQIFTSEKPKLQIFGFSLLSVIYWIIIYRFYKKKDSGAKGKNTDCPTTAHYNGFVVFQLCVHEWINKEKNVYINISIIIMRAANNHYIHYQWICKLFHLSINISQRTMGLLPCFVWPTVLICKFEKPEPIIILVIFAW